MRSTARKWIRYGTAALIVVTVAGLVVVGVERSRRMARPLPDREVGETDNGSDDPAVGIYTGFEYVETVAGRAIFALRSIRTLGKSSGWHEIEGVQLQLYDQGAPGPVVTAAGASFNIETRDAELRGPVHVSFPSGATITTQSGQFEASSRRFITDSEVVFMSGETVVESGRASYSMAENRILLTEDALMTSGGTSLRASTIDYQRDSQTVEFPDGCRIVQGPASIVAPRAVVELAEQDGPPERIVMSGGVAARRRSDGAEGGEIEAWAEVIAAERDGRGNWQLDATTTRNWVTVVMRFGATFYERELRTRTLRGVLGPDGPLNLRAEDGACIEEIPFEGEPRRAEAASARVWFKDGQATDMQLEQDVVIRGEGIEARGHRARVSTSAGVTMLHGDPSGLERALVVSERGRVTCDQVQIYDQEGRLEARGKVQGVLTHVSILGGAGTGEPAPAHFAGDLLEITGSGANYRLREGARLWQGHRLLIADEVTYREDTATVEASGHVRATFPPDQSASDDSSGDDVVVVARSLTYDRPGRRAIFRGNVRYSDPNYVLSATELDATFDEDNTLTQIVANGDVELRELASGRTMVGQHATRDVAKGVVHATGSPVRLTDATGTTVSSSSLTWNQADGSVTVAGSTETVYYPKEEP
jgi:lipopolysaccharide export system protein LptA